MPIRHRWQFWLASTAVDRPVNQYMSASGIEIFVLLGSSTTVVPSRYLLYDCKLFVNLATSPNLANSNPAITELLI